MKRREFLMGSAIAAGAAGRIWGQSPNKAKLDRIAIMTGGFRSVLKSPAYPDDPKRTLDVMDLPDVFAKRYGVHHVEVTHSQFASTESAYLNEFRDRMKKAKSQMNQIDLEFGILNISSPDRMLRVETIDLTKQWIDHAVVLSCPRVMLNQGTLAPEVRQAAIATMKTIGDYGKTKKVFVTLENRDLGSREQRGSALFGMPRPLAPATPPAGAAAQAGPGRAGGPVPVATWDVVVEVIKASGAWANPDVGNFPDEASRQAGLRAMFPMTSGSCHCHYNPESYSEADAIKISKEVGYKGLYSIEAAGNNGPDPYTAVQTILDELMKDI
jgi:hypothetical protein